jgi:hypothetical protein
VSVIVRESPPPFHMCFFADAAFTLPVRLAPALTGTSLPPFLAPNPLFVLCRGAAEPTNSGAQRPAHIALAPLSYPWLERAALLTEALLELHSRALAARAAGLIHLVESRLAARWLDAWARVASAVHARGPLPSLCKERALPALTRLMAVARRGAAPLAAAGWVASAFIVAETRGRLSVEEKGLAHQVSQYCKHLLETCVEAMICEQRAAAAAAAAAAASPPPPPPPLLRAAAQHRQDVGPWYRFAKLMLWLDAQLLRPDAAGGVVIDYEMLRLCHALLNWLAAARASGHARPAAAAAVAMRVAAAPPPPPAAAAASTASPTTTFSPTI